MSDRTSILLYVRFFEEHPNQSFSVSEVLKRSISEARRLPVTPEQQDLLHRSLTAELNQRCHAAPTTWRCILPGHEARGEQYDETACPQFQYCLCSARTVKEVIRTLQERAFENSPLDSIPVQSPIGTCAGVFSEDSRQALVDAVENGNVYLLPTTAPPTMIASGEPGNLVASPRVEVIQWKERLHVHETFEVQLRLLSSTPESDWNPSIREDVQLQSSWGPALDIRPNVRDVGVGEVACFTLRGRIQWIGVVRVLIDSTEQIALPIRTVFDHSTVLRDSQKGTMLYLASELGGTTRSASFYTNLRNATAPRLAALWHTTACDTSESIPLCKTYGESAMEESHAEEGSRASDARRKRFLAATLNAAQRQQRGMRDRLHNKHMRVFGLDVSIPYFLEDREEMLNRRLKDAAQNVKVERAYNPSVRVKKSRQN